MNQGLIKKPLFWTNLVVLVFFGLAVADVIFGWTNPSGPPPNPPGAVRADGSGNVGIGADPTGGAKLTVSGILNLLSNEITGINWPTASSSAASKGYVDAQAGGGPPGLSITLFGEASTTTASWPLAGGALSCATLGPQWTQAYRGYGPHWIGVDEIYDTNGNQSAFIGTNFFQTGEQFQTLINPNAVARTGYASDSVCSTERATVIPMNILLSPTYFAGRASACAQGVGGADPLQPPSSDNFWYCNVCVVCYRDT